MCTLELELSLEQQFSLNLYEKQVTKLSRDQAQELLIAVIQQLMIKDNAIRSLIRSGAGFG
jgi:Phycobilisome degradation protein nblA